ncbi:hypothetical protein DF018_22155 [Burkholderia cenocepacia]|nr:hypothetical protein DF018_22155 [Burkholderia cenocepacia]
MWRLPPAHAVTIRSFVEYLPEEITAVVVHCEGGYSRSCAIALGLHQPNGRRQLAQSANWAQRDEAAIPGILGKLYGPKSHQLRLRALILSVAEC